jgi:cystathionine beta-lyase/cystathionine gamma-synthase
MVSFELDGTLAEAEAFVKSRKYFALGESLGGVRALACLPCKMTHASIPADTRHALGLSDTLIRLSPGIESTRDLVADLLEGLDALDAPNALKALDGEDAQNAHGAKKTAEADLAAHR